MGVGVHVWWGLSKGWLVENEAQGRGGGCKVGPGFPEASGHQSGTGEALCQHSQFCNAQLSRLAYLPGTCPFWLGIRVRTLILLVVFPLETVQRAARQSDPGMPEGGGLRQAGKKPGVRRLGGSLREGLCHPMKGERRAGVQVPAQNLQKTREQTNRISVMFSLWAWVSPWMAPNHQPGKSLLPSFLKGFVPGSRVLHPSLPSSTSQGPASFRPAGVRRRAATQAPPGHPRGLFSLSQSVTVSPACVPSD